MTWHLAPALGVMAMVAAPVLGQDFQVQPVFDMGILANTLAQGAATQQAVQLAPKRKPGAALPATPEPSVARALGEAISRPPQTRPGPEARLQYVPTTRLQSQAITGVVARLTRQNPIAANAIKSQLAQNDSKQIFDGFINGSPLKADDAIDIVTVYTLIGWQIANRTAREISDAEIMGVRRQLAPALAGNPALRDPAMRAALGEEMKLLAIIIHAGWQGAVREGNVVVYSDGIVRMWQSQTGRDLRKVKLTATGFAPR